MISCLDPDSSSGYDVHEWTIPDVTVMVKSGLSSDISVLVI